MSDLHPQQDPAYAFMVVDIVANVLCRAGHPAEAAAYLTEEIRELTGARVVLLIQCQTTPGAPAHRVLSVSPARRLEWAETPAAHRLYEEAHDCPAARLWTPDAPSEVVRSLLAEGFERSLTVPLNVGDTRVGSLLAMGLPGEEHLESEVRLLGTLSGVVALVLRNGLLFESQEQAIQERTRELREANQALRESEARYQDLYDNAPDLYLSIDPATLGVLQCNQTVERVTGYRKDEWVGRSVLELCAPEGHETIVEAVRKLADRGGVNGVELAVRRKEGGLLPMSLSASVVRDAEGRLVRIRSIWRDISASRLLEERLRQAQKLEAIGQLAGGVAHDFNNILAAMTMNLSLLRLNPRFDDETREQLRDLESDAQRAAQLTRQLLMFSRRSVLEVKVLDLNEVVAQLLKLLRRLIGEDIQLEFAPAGALPPIEGDAGMIEQVVMNLVVNARDAMPQGGRLRLATTVETRARPPAERDPEEPPRPFVCLAVSDTGCGMDEATQKRIFEPFFTTKQVGKGTGLGLATAYGLVAQHRGWIEVDSQVGQGTAFRVFFPPSAQAVPGERSGVAPPAVERGHEGLLVVEDDPAVRRMLSRSLRALGYRVFEAATGQEAVNLWGHHRGEIDLLLTDLVMPEGMTGLDLAERLRADKSELRIIVSSGYSPERLRGGQTSADGYVYLPKPYEVSVLSQAVRTLLDRP